MSHGVYRESVRIQRLEAARRLARARERFEDLAAQDGSYGREFAALIELYQAVMDVWALAPDDVVDRSREQV